MHDHRHDHRKLGRELSLFDTDPLIGAPGPGQVVGLSPQRRWRRRHRHAHRADVRREG